MQIKRVVTSFIESNGRIMILRRSTKVGSYPGRWAGVSGYLEVGEDTLSRALKEIEEETGLRDSDLHLVSKGEPLLTYDKAMDTFWIVQPYLFITKSGNIRLNCEHIEYRWIEPEEIVDYDIVPQLDDTLERVFPFSRILITDSEIIDSIKKIEYDHEHGSSWIAEEAVTALRKASERYRNGTRNHFQKYLRKVGREIIKTRPSMASILNNVAFLLRRLKEAEEKKQDLSMLRDIWIIECDRLLQRRRNTFEMTIEEGAKIVPEHATLFTYSYSSTVLEVLKRSAALGKDLKVWVAESRPLFEGRRLAREVAQHVPTHLVIDAASGYFLDEMDLVMVGADSVLADGSIVNKVGTYLIALAAMEKKVPFYVICEGHKFNPISYVSAFICLEEKDSSELIQGETKTSLIARNPYFDITPGKLIKAIITEEGILRPDEVEMRILKMFEQIYFP